MGTLSNRRGLELAIGAVAVIAIVLIVLVIVIGFFFGGFSQMAAALSGIGGGANESAGALDVSGEIENISGIW